MKEIRITPQVYTTQEVMSSKLQVYTTQEGLKETKSNPQVCNIREGIEGIENDLQVYSNQEEREEIKNTP